jgi:hypothetical protein
MKIIKPGQFYAVDGIIYRAKKRINNCQGCALDNILLCPNIVDRRKEKPKLDCELSNIILIRI